jgi:hypothetical protein
MTDVTSMCKLPLSQRWKHRRAPKPKRRIVFIAPKPARAPIAPINEARALVERMRVTKWVAAQIVSYPPDRCLCCRKPIVFGAKWVELVNDDDRARFHADCLPAWRAQQELAARRAMGLDRNRHAQQDPGVVGARVPQ